MLLGFLFAISACFVWGLIFVIPDFLADYTAVEVVLGRYLSYGILSAFLLFRKGFSSLERYTLQAWIMAFAFALFSNIIYYLGVIAGLRFASAPLTVLVIGMAPIMIAVYGNWRVREISYRDLILPTIGIAIGIILVNVAEVDWTFSDYSIHQYVFGLLGGVAALVGWSWYAVNNARFLKRNPHIPASEWSTVIGVGTLAWTLLLALVFGLGSHQLHVTKFFSWSSDSLRYLSGVLILGVICSWLGCFLWNRASTYLPVSLMGPFLIFETIFGLAFVFLVQFRFPSWLELVGVSSMIGGIGLSIYMFRKRQIHT